MAKDPAMLWYWGDWTGGTATFTRHLKGCYMDVLNAQFNSGRLSLEEIKTVLGSDFGSAWPTLQKKFKQDSQNLFFNERMEEEKKKRQAFTESRRNNLKSHKEAQVNNHMDSHMENENENTVDNVIRIGVKKTFSVSIKTKYLHDKPIVIYDLREYFKKNDQLEQLEMAKWTKFDEFLEANPARVFADPEFLYNSFRAFHTGETINGKKKNFKPSFDIKNI